MHEVKERCWELNQIDSLNSVKELLKDSLIDYFKEIERRKTRV